MALSLSIHRELFTLLWIKGAGRSHLSLRRSQVSVRSDSGGGSNDTLVTAVLPGSQPTPNSQTDNVAADRAVPGLAVQLQLDTSSVSSNAS